MSTKGAVTYTQRLDNSKLKNDAQQAGDILKNSVGKATAGLGKSILQLGSSLGLAFGISAIDKSLEKFVKLEAIVGTTKFSSDFVQQWEDFAGKSGVGAEAAGKSLLKFNQAVGKAAQGNAEALNTFKKIGVAVRDNNGVMKSNETILYQVADGLKAVDSDAIKAELSTKLLGEEASLLAPEFAKGSAELRGLLGQADIMSKESVKMLAESKRSVDDFKQAVMVGFGTVIGGVAEFVGKLKKTQLDIEIEQAEKDLDDLKEKALESLGYIKGDNSRLDNRLKIAALGGRDDVKAEMKRIAGEEKSAQLELDILNLRKQQDIAMRSMSAEMQQQVKYAEVYNKYGKEFDDYKFDKITDTRPKWEAKVKELKALQNELSNWNNADMSLYEEKQKKLLELKRQELDLNMQLKKESDKLREDAADEQRKKVEQMKKDREKAQKDFEQKKANEAESLLRQQEQLASAFADLSKEQQKDLLSGKFGKAEDITNAIMRAKNVPVGLQLVQTIAEDIKRMADILEDAAD